jgi:plastocyanin
MRKAPIVALLAGFLVVGLWVAADRQGAAQAGGTIVGVVKFAGDAPAPKKLEPTKDQQVCGKTPLYDQSLMVDTGTKGVRWAVVSIAGDVKGKWDAKEIALDQKGCEFQPHVTVTPPGKLTVLNSDGVLHNFHSYSTKNPAINQAQPGFRKKMEVQFNQPEIVKITCDAHPWMTGWVIVSAQPYVGVTDEKGSFKIANVPPGTYTLEVWQETLAPKPITQQVAVKAGEETKVTFELKR